MKLFTNALPIAAVPALHRQRRSRRVFAVFGLAIVSAVFACHGRTSKETVDADNAIPECESYLASYRSCQGALGDAARGATEKNVASLQRAFRASDEPTRARLKESCASGLERLRKSCR